MKVICKFAIVLLIVLFIGFNTQVLADSTPAFESEVKSINQIADKSRLQSMLKSAHGHEENVLQIRLMLLEPEIIDYYGELQFTYSFSRIKDKTYTMSNWQKCSLYVEHVPIKIIDSTGNVIQQFRFSGHPGGSQETFSTFNGLCSSKTNEAHVNLSKIREDLINARPLNPIPTPTPQPTPTPRPSKYDVQILQGDKVVIGLNNGLMWQQSGSLETISWKKAQEFIEQINSKQYAGFSNWRLPTLEELISLREPIKNRNLYIDLAFDVKQLRCWTIDETGDNKAKVVDFTNNKIFSFLKISSQSVRAVRSTNETSVNTSQIRRDLVSNRPPQLTPTPHLSKYDVQILQGDKVVIDLDNGLMWQQSGSLETISWKKAQEFIEQLNSKQHAGFSNWRLPTLEELMLLRESIKSRNLYIDLAFEVKQLRCWTIDETEDDKAKVVDFTNNEIFSFLKISSQSVRAVRSLK